MFEPKSAMVSIFILTSWFDFFLRAKLTWDLLPNPAEAYSYILSASIRIGEDILEIAGFGDYILNGIASADLASKHATLAGYPIIHSVINDKHHRFHILLDGGNTILVSTNKDIVSLEILPANGVFGREMHEWFGNSTGLMGSLSSSRMIARDGVTVIEDPNEFGQEWQVRDRWVQNIQISLVVMEPSHSISY
jgi:hypothetical protein